MKLAWENSTSQPAGASDMPKPVVVQEQATRGAGPDFTSDEDVMRESQPMDQVNQTDKNATLRIIKPKRDSEGHMVLIQNKGMKKHLKTNHPTAYKHVWSKQQPVKQAYDEGSKAARSAFGY